MLQVNCCRLSPNPSFKRDALRRPLTQTLGHHVKSYFLDHVSSIAAAEDALRTELSGQEHPWLLLSSNGEVVACIDVAAKLVGEKNLHVQVNMSGKHYSEDITVIDLLQRIRTKVGGSVSHDA